MWKDGTALTKPRECCRTVAHAGSIILIGGGPSLRFKNVQWNELPDIPRVTPDEWSIGWV